MFSVVGEDQENTSIYVDYTVYESGQVEKIALGCEEQVVMSAPTELRFPSSDDEDLCSEISDEAMEVAVEVKDKVEYEKATDIITIEDDVAEKEETVFMNATTKVACANEVKVKEEKQTDDSEGELSNKTCPENLILREDDQQQTQCNKKQLVIGGDEAVKADCVEKVNIEEEIHVNDNNETTVQVVRKEESARQLTNKQEKIEMIVDDEIPLIQPIQEDEANKSNDEMDTGSSSSIKQDEFKVWGRKSEVWRWSILMVVLIWCICHWYFKLPYLLSGM